MIAESTAHDRGTADVGGKPDARLRAPGVAPSQRRAGSGTAPPGRRRPRPRHARSGQAPTGPPDLAQTAREAVVRYLHDATAMAGAEPVVTAPPIAAADIAPKGAARAAPSNPPTAVEAPVELSPPAPSTTEFPRAAEAAAAEAAAAEAGAAEAAAPETAAGPDTSGMTDAPDATGAAAPGTAESVGVRAAAVSVATLDKMEAMAAKLETDIAAALRRQAELQAGAGAAAEAAVQAAQKAWLAAGTSVEAERHVRRHLRVISRDMVITAALVLVGLIILLLFAASAH
jgi:transcription termination factor Rho